jgi:methionyl-tRNA formyltransferase
MANRRRIVVLCATRRGRLFLARLLELARPSGSQIVVFSFREEAWEPPFLEDIRSLAKSGGAEFHEAKSVGAPQYEHLWGASPPDLLFAVSWRYLIPPEVYRRAGLGAFVFHDSLLPKYRGFAPTVWAIINGEGHSGATLFHMSDAFDAGDVVAQERVQIGPDDTIAQVMDRVTEAYLALLDHNFEALLSGAAPRVAQDHAAATYTCRRLPEDSRIDWSQPAGRVYNLIRATTRPYPGAFSTLDGRKLTVWSARRSLGQLDAARRYVGGVPGRVADIRKGEGVLVLAGDGQGLWLTEVQPDGAEPALADAVLNSLSMTLR